MNRTKLLLFFLLLLAGIAPARVSAQIFIGLHGGISLPYGDYADSRMSDNEWMFTQGHQHKAGAGIGWTAGVEVSYAMPFHTNLEALFVGEFMQSNPSDDVKSYYAVSYAHRFSQCSRYDMQLPRFRHIPLLLGVRYKYPLTKTIHLYAQALGGLNMRFITPWSLYYADASWPYAYREDNMQYNNMKLSTYTSAYTPALRLGGGFIVGNLVTIGFDFNLFGAAPLSWDEEETVRYDVYGNVKEINSTNHFDYYNIYPAMVTVSLGLRLKVFNGARTVQDW